jgi:hypothetical protein
VSRRGRLWFLAACLAVFALVAVWVARSTPSQTRAAKAPVTVTLAPGASRPAGLTVSDLADVGQFQARFNADRGAPRLILALAPT